MRNKTSVGFNLLATTIFFLTSCAPQTSMEGVILQIPPEGALAWQFKPDMSGKDNCQVGGRQQAKVIGETFWSPNTGASGDGLSTDLVEIRTTNLGSCDRIRPVFLKKTEAKRLQREGELPTPEGGIGPLEPISTPAGWTK